MKAQPCDTNPLGRSGCKANSEIFPEISFCAIHVPKSKTTSGDTTFLMPPQKQPFEKSYGVFVFAGICPAETVWACPIAS